MKILAMIMLVLLILAVGFVGNVYKKNAMFLPALFGIGGFPNIKKKDYYQADGTFRQIPRSPACPGHRNPEGDQHLPESGKR